MHSSLYSGLSLHKRAPLAHIARAPWWWYTYPVTIAMGTGGAYCAPASKPLACLAHYAERLLITRSLPVTP